ncbi:MAG: hydroxyacid dehydrogenase [Gammaproteobacteria bacterium]|nr:hydroxyacid dehydrogenase [Gammaproteobacteria bacterium]
MPKVLVAGKLHQSGRDILDSESAMDVTYIDEISESSYAPHIHDTDALLIRTQPLSAGTVALANNLKFVSRHGVGYDAVDVEALNQRGIPLAICGDVNSTSVAEHAAMMLLAVVKKTIRADAAVRHNQWEWRNQLEAGEVRHKNLLLLGYGRIGQRIAQVMQGFELTIRAFDPYLLEHGWPDGPATPVASLEEGLAWAELISISVPHSGKPLISRREFELMRDGVVIVNTARGGIIDEPALIDALTSGRVGGVGLDVFNNEPVTADNPLTRFDQALLTPHIAGLTDGAAERIAISSAQNILDFFANSLDHTLIVNRDALQHE